MTDDLSMWADPHPQAGSVPFYENDQSTSVEMVELPSKIMERIEEHHETIMDLRIEAKGPNDKNYKSASGKLIVDPDRRPSPDAMGQQLMRLAERHAKRQENPEDFAYRTAIRYVAPNGDTKWIRREFTVDIVNGEPVFDDSVSADQERTDLKVFRFFFEQMKAENEELRRFIIDREKAYAERVDKLTDAVCRSAHEIPAIATSVGEVAKASATTLHEAAVLWKDSEKKSTDQRKLELEAELARSDAQQQQQKWDMAMQVGSIAIPILISKAMGIPPEGAMMLVQAMQGMAGSDGGLMGAIGGMGGAPQPMPGMPTPQAVQAPQQAAQAPQQAPAQAQPSPELTADIPDGSGWTPPELPQLAFSGKADNGEPEPNGFDEHLLLWFHMLTTEQEQQTRAIVGAEIYDEVRSAAGTDHATAVRALRKLKGKIDTLSMDVKMRLTRQLMVVLRAHAKGLWNMLSVAAVDQSVPD